jgi:hypothetical protein
MADWSGIKCYSNYVQNASFIVGVDSLAIGPPFSSQTA